jgi:NACalpha-BTF3-like transcription factor
VIRNQLGVNLHHVTGLNYIFIRIKKAQQMINYPTTKDTLHLQRKMTLAFSFNIY